MQYILNLANAAEWDTRLMRYFRNQCISLSTLFYFILWAILQTLYKRKLRHENHNDWKITQSTALASLDFLSKFIFVLFKHKFYRKTVAYSRIQTWIVGVKGEHADHLTTTTGTSVICSNRKPFIRLITEKDSNSN